MAYTKTNWVNNDAPYLNADNLNNMEDGIFNNDTLVATKLEKNNPGFTGTLTGALTSITEINTSNMNVLDYRWNMVSDELHLTYNGVSPVGVIEVGSRTLRQKSDYLEYGNKNVVVEDAYATDLVGGTIKIKVIGTDAYITTDGSTPGA